MAVDFPTLNQDTTGNAATATSLTGLTATVSNLNTVTGALGTAAFTASGAYATAAQGTLAANALPSASFTDAAVTGKLLTGYVSGAGTVAATDSILQAINKINGNDLLKAPINNPTFTGTVAGITAAMVGAPAGSGNSSGTNTGDDAVNALYSGLVTNATHTGDATGATALTVVKINGTSLAGLATGILKNTTGTGVPSIAVAVDFPTLNQDTTGNAATATNIAGGSIGQLPYQSGADTTALLAAGTPGQLLQSNGGAAPSWVTPSAGDVVKAGTQTFTGQNTFTSTITAKGYASAVQYVSLNKVSTFAADGSGVVMMTTASGTDAISTITGCNSGDVGQGQNVTFVVAAYTGGTLTFTDTTAAGITTPDAMILSGIATSFAPAASVSSLGATITLLCTTINSTKVWAEVGRSLNGN